jgi:hypothetical protein
MRGARTIALLFAAACGAPSQPPRTAPVEAPASEIAAAPRPGCTRDGWCVDRPRIPFDGGRAVWTSGPNDIWIASGALYHFDGERWSPVELPVLRDVVAIWGNGPREIYVVAGTKVLRFDGERWEELLTLQYNDPSIWASGPRDVHVADGQILRRFDGESWSEHDIGAPVSALFGRGPNDVYAAIEAGYVGHWDGSAWSVRGGGRLGRLAGISGSSDEVVAVGAEPGTYTVSRGGGRFELEAMSPNGSRAVWTTPSGTHILAGPYDTMLHVARDGVRAYSAQGMQSEYLQAVHGASDDFAVAVGLYGVIAWNGSEWTRIDEGRAATLERVRGAGDRVFAGPYRFDGERWTDQSERPRTAPALRGVWGSSASDVWAVGDDGRILHFDGAAVTRVESATSATLHAIWGSAADDVRAVGDAGTIVRWDGRAWALEPSGTEEPLYAIWGSSPREVWAGGSAGTMLHHDGSAWSRVHSDLRQPISAIHGSARDDVWAGAIGGELTHFDGRSWIAERPLEMVITSLFARSRHALFVASGRALERRDADGRTHYLRVQATRAVGGRGSAVVAVGERRVSMNDGTSWTGREVPASLRAVWLADRSTAFAVGEGEAMLRTTGGPWETLHAAEPPSAPRPQLIGVDAAGSVIAGIRSDGSFVWLDGVDRAVPEPSTSRLLAVAVRAVDDVVAVGEGGRIAAFDGARWTEHTIDGAPRLTHVWLAAGIALARSENSGAMVRRTSGGWEPVPPRPHAYGFHALWAAEGTAFTVGWEGRVEQLAGDRWVSHSDSREELAAITFADARTAFAVGARGAVMRWDGEAWSAIAAPGDVSLIDAWASGPNELWAITSNTVWRWDGSAWSTSFTAPSGSAPTFRGIHGTSRGDVHVGAEGGAAWRWDGTQWSVTNPRSAQGYHEAELVGHGDEVYLRMSYPRRLLRWEGSAWIEQPYPDFEVSSVRAIGGGRLLALTQRGRFGQLWRWDGSAWSQFAGPEGPYAIFGDETRGLYAITSYGAGVARFDGTAWQDTGFVRPRDGLRLNDLAVGADGRAIAVLSEGGRMHYDGSTWRSGARGTLLSLQGVWGSAPDDVWAVGAAGTILHYDGQAWTAIASSTEASLDGVWGRGPRDVYAFGDRGTILHWDGERWSRQASGSGAALFDVWGSGSRIFAVGADGVVLHRDVP